MDSYLIDPKRKLHVCGNNPTCDGCEIEEGEFRIKGYDGPIVECEKCGETNAPKWGVSVNTWLHQLEECKHVRFCVTAKWHHRKIGAITGAAVRKSDAYFVLRDGAAGVFWRPIPSEIA